MKTLIRLTAVAAFLLAGTASADILDLDNETCERGAVALNHVTGNAGGATECFGAFDGNDANAYDGYETGGIVYTEYAKQDMPSSLSGASIGLEVLVDDTAVCQDDDVCNVGTWSFDDFGAESFLIILKASSSPGFAVWLFSGADAASTSGTWFVAWKNSLSHFAVYTCDRNLNQDCGGGMTSVPEPGTLALLGLGLIGMGAARRRKVA